MTVQLKPNNIYTMDCIKGIKKMKEQSLLVDVIVTSPPYNIGKEYTKYNDVRPRDEYLDWMEAVAKESNEIMTEHASFFLNVGGKPSENILFYKTPFIGLNQLQFQKKM